MASWALRVAWTMDPLKRRRLEAGQREGGAVEEPGFGIKRIPDPDLTRKFGKSIDATHKVDQTVGRAEHGALHP